MADLTVKCENCEAELPAEFKKYGNYSVGLFVEPCETCMDKARDEAKEEGRQSGVSEGQDIAREEYEKEKMKGEE